MGVPVQVTPLFVNVATTLKVAVSGAVVAFVAVKAGTLPVPLFEPRPMASAVRDQEKTAPGVLLVKTIDGTLEPAQYVWLATALTFGTGFTVTVNVTGVPVQMAPVVGEVVGVTVIVAVTGAVPLFTPTNEAMLPEPLAARPMAGLLFVQLKIVPATGPLKVTIVVELPLQTV